MFVWLGCIAKNADRWVFSPVGWIFFIKVKIAALVACLCPFGKNLAILACLLLLVSCQNKNPSINNMPSQVKVARVVSGQTLEVLGLAEQPNLISQVRLIGLDAPDLRQRPWGEESKQLLETLISGAENSVKLEFDVEAKDQVGRTLAYVWKDKLLLNEEILKQGYALFIARSPNHKYDQRLERSQQWARIMSIGIWDSQKPMRLTPGEFRRIYR
ncbi:thermonuclease family protein [Cronbergia sp. UHCC 0137]|uniref:thermonuclease family protein n=1 Tax=Cronbergia sp. UHCC 0137 TaxID=3110239 RepID=UPI002B20B6FC|nr:thermonuclease family protein [Cronbergia sp. UHCC 0137]MEA5620525.1 thermonuclease family protein [Cronbergia sp. UHCC 0137]